MNLVSQQKPNRIVVAVSGRGRSLSNLIDCQSRFDYEIVGVVSSSPSCEANKIAKQRNLSLFIGDFKRADQRKLANELYSWIVSCRADWVVLAGFLKKFPLRKDFVGRIINIHPALLPKYGGLGMYGQKVHKAVLEAGEPVSGATIHFVDDNYDQGQIIAQTKVIVSQEMTPAELAQVVFDKECQMYPRVIHDLIAGRLPLSRGMVKTYEC